MWFGLYIVKNYNITMGLYHALCLVPGIVLGNSLWRRDLEIPSLKQWLALMLSTALFNGAVIFSYDHFGYIFLDSQKVMTLLNGLGFAKQHLLILGLYFVFINSTLEELFWRGVIFNKLDSLQVPFKHFGITVSSLLYGAFHYLILRLVVYPGWAEIGFLMLVGYGAFLAWLYRKTGSITLACLVHGFLTDLAAILLLLDLVQHYP
jgi:membrane protease YdiL (CAAX protease family)